MKKAINNVIAKTIENAAIKSSESLSWFFLYQPETPEKLKYKKK